jgi:hypothetical protein
MCKCHKVIFSSISESTCDNAIVRDTNNVAIELSLEVTLAQWFLSSNIETDIELSLMYFFIRVNVQLICKVKP